VKRAEYPTVPEETLKGIVRTRFDSPDPTEAQLARRARNTAIIKKLGLPTNDHLPVVEDESVVKFRNPDEVAKRCLATVFCAVKGETNDKAFVDKLIEEYSGSGYLSPEEKKFIADPTPGKQQLIDFCWRYECVHVFLWALGGHERLEEPNTICKVPDEVRIIKKIGPKDFVSQAKLRPAAEILEMADLYYRLHWAAIELRLKSKTSKHIDEGIIRERHRALNWLIRYLDQAWDDVTTDT